MGEPVPVMGKYTQLWMELFPKQSLDDLSVAFRFSVEAGSARKPNKDRQVAQSQEALQVIFPLLMQQYQMQGDPMQVNAILRMWAMANDHPHPEQLMLPDLRQQIQAQQQAQQQQAQAETEAEGQRQNQELQHKEGMHEQKLRHQDENQQQKQQVQQMQMQQMVMPDMQFSQPAM